MHGEKETSQVTRGVATLAHLFFFGIAVWIDFGDGCRVIWGWVGTEVSPGDPGRRWLLFLLSLVLVVRMTLALFCLLRRRLGWEELAGIVCALFLYQVVFALLGARTAAPLAPWDVVAVVLYALGSYLNTASEWQRKRFKERPENQGRLYTGGLFRYARHINYFGDTLWVTAWAMVTRSAWSLMIPAALVLAFLLAFIPALEQHLKTHYGEAYLDWEKRSKAYIPFLY